MTDANNGRVEKFTSAGVFLGAWGEPGSGAGQFTAIAGVAADPFGFVYVADAGRVQKFTNAGVFQFAWTMRGANALAPYMLTADPDGHVFASEYGAGLVDAFAVAGAYLDSFDSRVSPPTGLAIDSDGFLYVASDAPTCLIEKMTGGGGHVAAFGGLGAGDGRFLSPLGVAVRAGGPVVVADQGADQVQAFATDGGFLYRFGQTGSGPGNFLHPSGVAIAAAGAREAPG